MNVPRKVLFTPEAFAMQRWGGVSHSFVRVAESLSERSWEVTVFAGLHGNRHLADGIGFRSIGYRIGKSKNFWRTGLALSRYWMRLKQVSDGCVIHDTYYHHQYRDIYPNCPYVVTVHDMIGDLFPSESGWSDRARERRRLAVAAANAIVVPSQATADDLKRLWSIEEERIWVAPHGVKTLIMEEWASPGWPYLLYVGSRKRYKDFAVLQGAMKELRSSGWEGGIILFGDPLSVDERKGLVDAGIPADRVLETSGSDRILASIYAQATALVYTSRYEGFGMPIVEAMTYGCPVVCADTPACVEVADGAALVSAVGDVSSFVANIKQILEEKVVRDQLIAKGKERAARQGWNVSAAKHEEAYTYAWKHWKQCKDQL